MKKKYLDANVFLEGILHGNKNSKEVVFRMLNGEFMGVSSTLTWDEIVFITRKFLGKDISKKEGEKFLKLPNLHLVNADRNITTRAQGLIEIYNLKARDAIHVASALSCDCEEIISNDNDFDEIEEIKRKSLKNWK